MFSVMRKTIKVQRARGRRPTILSGSVSNHLLRDLGFDGAQVEEILRFTIGQTECGGAARGLDAESSRCTRVAANSNHPSRRIER